MILTIIILSVLVVVLGFTTFNLLKKNERAEDVIVSYEKHINEIDEVIQFINKRVQEIDIKGTFSSDDEVGFFFERLKLLNELLKEYRLKR
jgi:hypothetical protein